MAIKNLTYHNLMRVAKMVMEKGYNEKEAIEIAKQRFAEFNPYGMSIEESVRRLQTKEEWQRGCEEAKRINARFL